MADKRRAIIQRLQALQSAGVQELSKEFTEKLLETLRLEEESVRKAALISPADSSRNASRTSALSEFGAGGAGKTARSASGEAWNAESRSASGEAQTAGVRSGISGDSSFGSSSKFADDSSVHSASNVSASASSSAAVQTGVWGSVSVPSVGNSTSAKFVPSASFGSNSSGTRRDSRLMAPKRSALSLEIIVPPHEDYSALTEMEDRHEALRQLGEKVSRCVRCIELVSNRTQTVLGVGNPYADLMFLGEAPGADEDRQGIPFVGRAGKLLTDMIEKGMQINRMEQTYICNILRCRPPGNRTPLPEEAFKCRQFLDTQIDIVKPKFICCLGASAAQYLLDTTTTISKMRLREFRYRESVVVCTYHPAYLLRNPSQKRATWQDLQFLMQLMGLPIPAPSGEKDGA